MLILDTTKYNANIWIYLFKWAVQQLSMILKDWVEGKSIW